MTELEEGQSISWPYDVADALKGFSFQRVFRDKGFPSQTYVSYGEVKSRLAAKLWIRNAALRM